MVHNDSIEIRETEVCGMILRVAIALFILTSFSISHSQTIYKDSTLGFKLSLPKEWIELPCNPEAPWLIKQFFCEKSYPYDYVNSSGAHRTLRDHPKLNILCFPININPETIISVLGWSRTHSRAAKP